MFSRLPYKGESVLSVKQTDRRVGMFLNNFRRCLSWCTAEEVLSFSAFPHFCAHDSKFSGFPRHVHKLYGLRSVEGGQSNHQK